MASVVIAATVTTLRVSISNKLGTIVAKLTGICITVVFADLSSSLLFHVIAIDIFIFHFLL